MRPPRINTAKVKVPLFRAEGWEPALKQATAIHDRLCEGSMDSAAALKLADIEFRQFADVAELELVANTASEISKYKTRGRKQGTTWQSVLKVW